VGEEAIASLVVATSCARSRGYRAIRRCDSGSKEEEEGGGGGRRR
jgi:hypothetical protein